MLSLCGHAPDHVEQCTVFIFLVSERMDNPVCHKARLAQGESEALQKHMACCCVFVASLLNTCVGKHSVIV